MHSLLYMLDVLLNRIVVDFKFDHLLLVVVCKLLQLHYLPIEYFDLLFGFDELRFELLNAPIFL
jgi:hypothetical protein